MTPLATLRNTADYFGELAGQHASHGNTTEADHWHGQAARLREKIAARESASAALYGALECPRYGFIRSLLLRQTAERLREAGLPRLADRADHAADDLSDVDMLALQRELA